MQRHFMIGTKIKSFDSDDIESQEYTKDRTTAGEFNLTFRDGTTYERAKEVFRGKDGEFGL